MARSLCGGLEHKLSYKKKAAKKRKRGCRNKNDEEEEEEEGCNNFPSAKEIAGLNENTLNNYCSLGYRAKTILQIARDIECGKLNLSDLETISDPDLIHQQLIKIKGFGAFTAANVMMCIGFYQHIPVDTETLKHLAQVRPYYYHHYYFYLIIIDHNIHTHTHVYLIW